MKQDIIGLNEEGNYSHLDIQHNHYLLDKGKKEEDGEKHVYCVLENSGRDDFEDLEASNRVMQYEIPVSPKEM